MAYMFVHDGLVHRRFPVGPIADVPYFRRVAASHKVHSTYDGDEASHLSLTETSVACIYCTVPATGQAVPT
jgi:hypothetical protein